MKRFIIPALLTATMSTQALAWGAKEQGAVIGILGTLFVQHLNNGQQRPQPQYQQQYQQPQPQYNYNYYNDDLAREYERGRLERQRREYEEAKRRAFQCGYNGNCN